MNEVTKCPKCGGEFEKGAMQASYVVFWNKDNIEENLTSQSSVGKKTLESEAFRCKNCELIIFYYGKEVKRFSS